jgi:hypothetical protein
VAKLSSEEKIARGRRARTLLNDAMLQESFAEIKAKILSMWRKSPKDMGGQPEREWLFHQYSALELVEGYLTRVAESGSFELKTAAQNDGQDLGSSESGE